MLQCFAVIMVIVLGVSRCLFAQDTSGPGDKGNEGELLYNGIQLPADWPPQVDSLTREPLPVPPYLKHPPAVIPIDVGRQLFVDDFLVQETTLERTHYLPEYYSGNPVVFPNKKWETNRTMVFSDGVLFDPADRLFKMWYWSGHSPDYVTCMATSRDGIHWDKPTFDVVPGTNIVQRDEPGLYRDSNTVWLDHEEQDPARRFKMFRVVVNEKKSDVEKQVVDKWIKIAFSPDGIHWTMAAESNSCGDRTTVFYNPFRKVWVYGLRDGAPEVSRCRRYREHTDILLGARFQENGQRFSTYWVGADELDPDRSDLTLRRPQDRPWDLIPSQLYNLDCVAYESLMLGLFSIWRGQPVDRPKVNEVCVGYSRDGFHWSRPDRRAFCPISDTKGTWNYSNVQSAGGCCLVVGDKLYFYVSGRKGAHGTIVDGECSTGLAILRRDGFSSLDAGEKEGTLTTRPVKFSGKQLFVNVNSAKGAMAAEVLDENGKVIAPFSKENCTPITADITIQPVSWKGAADLASLAGKPVQFRFYLRDGSLYAFWVSPDDSGASRGYVAAGGPGFVGATDMQGTAAYKVATETSSQ
jgi:hypothetical protein